jgi:hypothetical protein
VLANRDFAKVSKSRNGSGIDLPKQLFYFNNLARFSGGLSQSRQPLEGDANLAAIRSAFERLNHPKPRALNGPTCGNDHAALGLRAPQWCAKRRSN